MRSKLLIIFIAAGVILFSVIIYIISFWSHGFSKEPSAWGAFSDYLNPFISIANLIIFIWLSIEVFHYNANKDKQSEEFQKSIEKPILILKSTSSKEFCREIWAIVNIGNGAALNLKVAESNGRQVKWIGPVTKCYSLGKGDAQELPWLMYANIICVVYEDIFKNKYVTIAADDESYIQAFDEKFNSFQLLDGTIEKSNIEDFLKLNTQRLGQALETLRGSMHSNTTTLP
jgi:hypothetical protein